MIIGITISLSDNLTIQTAPWIGTGDAKLMSKKSGKRTMLSPPDWPAKPTVCRCFESLKARDIATALDRCGRLAPIL
jgi:hypothetical protein